MTNKTKKSKWLKLALISTATVSTLATIPASICATNVKTSTPAVDNNLEATTYYDVFFRLKDTDKDAGAKLSGSTYTHVRSGRMFGMIDKPTATKLGWTFKGWATEATTEVIASNTKISSNMTVYAVFENTTTINVQGDTEVALGSKAFYTATVSTGQNVTWYVTDDTSWSGVPSSQYVEISNEEGHKGELTTKGKLSTATSTTYVFAAVGDEIPTSITPGASNVLQIKVVNPAIDTDKVITHQTVDSKEVYYSINIQDLYTPTGNVTLTPLDGGSAITKAKTEFNLPLIFGDKVTVIDNNFLPIENGVGFTIFNNTITFSNVIYIGNGFLNDNTVFDKPLEFPSTLRYIGDGFLSDSTKFNSRITFGTAPTLGHIGKNFMDGCTSFGAKIGTDTVGAIIDIPSSVNEIGEAFMHNCTSQHAITIGCDATSFVASPQSFAIDSATTAEHKILVNVRANAKFDEISGKFQKSEATLIRELFTFNYGPNDNCFIDADYNLHYLAPGSGICSNVDDKPIIDVDNNSYDRKTFNYPLFMNPNPSGELGLNGFYFLMNCIKFNQPIYIPASITTIRESFMCNCNEMTSMIIIDGDVSQYEYSDDTCSTNDGTAPCFVQGIPIGGTYAAAFKAKFPNRNAAPFRKLI